MIYKRHANSSESIIVNWQRTGEFLKQFAGDTLLFSQIYNRQNEKYNFYQLNRVIFSHRRRSAIFIYSEFNSMPIKRLSSCFATSPVVPLPKNGSSTVPPIGHPDKMQGLINSSGNVAK